MIVDDNSHVLAKIMRFFHLVNSFMYLNQIQFCSAVNSISEQINLFKRQSSVCAYVCVNYVNYKFVYSVTFVVSKTVF